MKRIKTPFVSLRRRAGGATSRNLRDWRVTQAAGACAKTANLPIIRTLIPLRPPYPIYAVGVKALSGAMLAVAWLSAQPAPPRQPRFEDYPATQIYKGKPAPPKVITAEQQRYRTRIREGVEKGWGVLRDGEERSGPNFAGNMIVVQWGCGSPCLMMAMVDAVTGDVYSLPLAMKDRSMHDTLALPWLRIGNSVGGNPEVNFRQDSRLLVIKASPDYFKEIPHSYAYYYLWRDHHWTLLHRDSLD